MHELVAELGEQRPRVGALRPGEHRVDLGVGAGADRFEQQLRLATEVGVDGAGGEPGPPGDVGQPGLLVALVDEYLDGRREQPLVCARRDRHADHPAMITIIIKVAKHPICQRRRPCAVAHRSEY